MTRAAAALALLLLGAIAGCSNPDNVVFPDADANPVNQQCARDARNAPEARAAWRQMAPDGNNRDRVVTQARAAQLDAYRSCVAQHGEPIPGGVAPARPG